MALKVNISPTHSGMDLRGGDRWPTPLCTCIPDTRSKMLYLKKKFLIQDTDIEEKHYISTCQNRKRELFVYSPFNFRALNYLRLMFYIDIHNQLPQLNKISIFVRPLEGPFNSSWLQNQYTMIPTSNKIIKGKEASKKLQNPYLRQHFISTQIRRI